MRTAQRVFLLIFLLFAVSYIATIPVQPYAGRFIVKALPVLTLSVLALTNVPGLKGKLLLVALLFCAGGDIALALGQGQYFIIGLGLFLVGHIVYIVLFSRELRLRASRIPIAAVLVAYAIAIAVAMTPYLKDMLAPVYGYLVVITLMGVFAALRETPSRLVLYGAISFIISDSILAINRFMIAAPGSDYLVMVTYYLAQLLIVWGFLQDEGQQHRVAKEGQT